MCKMAKIIFNHKKKLNLCIISTDILLSNNTCRTCCYIAYAT